MYYKIDNVQSPRSRKPRKKKPVAIQTPMTEAQFAKYYQLLESIIRMQTVINQMNK